MTLHSFETKRLFITPTQVSDSALVLELFNTPGWLRFIGDRQVHSSADAQSYIQHSMKPQQDRLGFGSYTISLQNDRQKIGLCGLYDRAGVDGIDIGFALLPRFYGKGYALEAAECMRDAAFQTFGLTTLRAITQKDNLPSQKLLEKIGMHQSGTTILPNDTLELFLYEMMRPQ